MSDQRLDAVRQARRLIEEAYKLTHLWERNYSRARSLVEDQLAGNADDILLLTCLGAILADQRHHLEAVRALKRAVANGSTDRNTYFNMGVAVFEWRTPEEARGWFERANALQADPESWEAYFDPQGQ
ncbi:UDP-N-acetylglucosamine-peptide N-acetylglucosaminyltransferase [Steroidobacter agaridevorans]|uniref:UDP-N-acetylglucosamine-peptide N-acetylglucosaminyltransferase n=1 Tax=Steroidobacter agaridevorans TaxID=2695856 RepID=UPI00132A11AB|nr:UDP-N-acetylglucosamine-peptide N-acetylglucosaminyltransferase [Steroidobacter agaridevorans]GFE87699.1 hypothetical protein GCM10011488_26530 [Steroidobacter agaridevorans]